MADSRSGSKYSWELERRSKTYGGMSKGHREHPAQTSSSILSQTLQTLGGRPSPAGHREVWEQQGPTRDLQGVGQWVLEPKPGSLVHQSRQPHHWQSTPPSSSLPALWWLQPHEDGGDSTCGGLALPWRSWVGSSSLRPAPCPALWVLSTHFGGILYAHRLLAHGTQRKIQTSWQSSLALFQLLSLTTCVCLRGLATAVPSNLSSGLCPCKCIPASGHWAETLPDPPWPG